MTSLGWNAAGTEGLESSEQKKMCLQRATSHCSAPLCSIPGKVTVQFPYCGASLLSTAAGSSMINICHQQLEQRNHPRQAASGCAVLSQQLEESPRLVLHLSEQVNAMQALPQPPGNNFVKQRGILKCLGAVKLPRVSRKM